MEPLLSVTTSVLIALTVGAISFFFYDKFRYKDVWSKNGVKQLNLSSIGLVNIRAQLHQIMTEYGDTVGFYRAGSGPTLITRDTALLKQILVKDFNNFSNRAGNIISKSPLASSVFFSEDSRWKRLRQITSPSFATGKLKGISTQIVQDSASKLADVCLTCAKSGQLLPIKGVASRYSSEVIARVAFGLNTNAIDLGPTDDDFTKHAKNVIKKNRGKLENMLLLVLRSFPSLSRLLIEKLGISYLDPVTRGSFHYFRSVLRATVPARKEYENSKKPKPADLLQTMVSAQMHEKTTGHSTDSEFSKALTEDELLGQSMLIAFAAFDTTSSTLQMALYCMARHPEVQEKVYEEISSVVKSETPTHEELGQLKYMEQVINETSRLFTIVALVTRHAKENRTYGNVTIPKDATIFIPIESIHKDPKHWPNPEQFDPDRFTEEAKSTRDSIAWMPFGHGPRLCIGMRLALLELKSAMVQILRKVKFELNDTTEPKRGEEVKLRGWQSLLATKQAIRLACIER